MKSLAFALTAAFIGALPAGPAQADPIGIPERIKGAERVVVASVAAVSATFEVNQYGDQIIVSHVTLSVEEALKGAVARTLDFDVEGGTVGGVTLEVSSLPRVKAGERAVFLLERAASGIYVPHLRGQGILKLGPDERVTGSSLTLAAVREMAAATR